MSTKIAKKKYGAYRLNVFTTVRTIVWLGIRYYTAGKIKLLRCNQYNNNDNDYQPRAHESAISDILLFVTDNKPKFVNIKWIIVPITAIDGIQ